MPWLNVVDNVALGLRLRGVPRDTRRRLAAQKLALVGLEAFAQAPVWQLSGGMQQRVGIARALASDPDVLLMDEPLGALDAFTRESLQELVLQLWQRTGKTIFNITHDVEGTVSCLAPDCDDTTPGPHCPAAWAGVQSRVPRWPGGPAYSQSDTQFIAWRERVLDWIAPGVEMGIDGGLVALDAGLLELFPLGSCELRPREP